MNEKGKKWIEALKQFHIDPNVKVICPECDKGHLILKTEPFGDDKVDWYMICDSCGNYNVATKSLSN